MEKIETIKNHGSMGKMEEEEKEIKEVKRLLKQVIENGYGELTIKVHNGEITYISKEKNHKLN